MPKQKDKATYYPDKGPVWLTARSLQVVSTMETFEEEDREPQLEASIQGVAQFSRNLGISVIGDTGTYTRDVRFSISSQDYKKIVEKRKQLIQKHGVDDDINLFCNDTLGTSASISHTYAEYSEVGKLWDESWSVMLIVPNNLMQQLLETIQFDRNDLIEIGISLLGVYTDKDPDEFSYNRDQSMLFLKPRDDEQSGEVAFGYVHSLGMGSRKGTSDYLDSEAHLDEAQIGSVLRTKLHAIQTLLKKIKTTLYIVVILLLCALLWLAA